MNDSAAAPKRQRRSTPAKAKILRNAQTAAKNAIRKVGRPSAYDPALCEPVMALGIQGKSLAGIAAALHVDKGTLVKWANEFPQFSNALARAKTYEQDHWETKGYKALGRKHFQAQVWRTSMAARFKDDYTERSGSGLADALPDFLAAITEAADRRRQKALEARNGDDAKPVNRG
ncbi:hypothetical protein [Reyranella sp.]|uniref:hypothetical protein n=1 Tax=Reyranella sp. TaxID=1929291 RepID=UPI003D0E1D90